MSSIHSIRADFAASTGEKPVPAISDEGLAAPVRQFRIDTGHSLPAVKSPQPEPMPPTLDKANPRLVGSQDDSNRHHSWLQLHATELIERLQSWSADLDAREAQLNARTALLEHRERQLRLEQQNSRLEVEELTQSLEREVAEIRAAARRLAFE
jgi:hypothetical protein